MPDCIYCGQDAGEHDEHEDCWQQSVAMDAMIEDQPCVYCDFPMSRHSYWSSTSCIVDGPPAVKAGGPS